MNPKPSEDSYSDGEAITVEGWRFFTLSHVFNCPARHGLSAHFETSPSNP